MTMSCPRHAPRPDAPGQTHAAGLPCCCTLLRQAPAHWTPWRRANACLLELHAALVNLQKIAVERVGRRRPRKRACRSSRAEVSVVLAFGIAFLRSCNDPSGMDSR